MEGSFSKRQSDIRERSDGDQRDFVRIGMNHFNDQVGGPARIEFAFAGREIDIAQAVFAVPELRGDQLLEKRMLRSGGDGNVATIRERDELHGVFETLRGSDVSGDDGEGADVEFRGVQREHDGHGVVGAGVGINDDFSGLGGGDI